MGSHIGICLTSTFTEVPVITLDSFNKASNNIYKSSEKLPGERKPYQFLQESRPILILDEPQNMESTRSKEALRTLHPLFALRYSATHRTSPNLIYRLTPFDAYRRNLVKKIQVLGVTQHENFNQPFLALKSISLQDGITARVTAYVSDHSRTREADIVLKQGDNLYAKTGREEHKDGYRVAEINAVSNTIQFDNGLTLVLNDTIGPSRPAIFRVQLERTIEQHMEIQERLLPQGIKVLSLFFVDRVVNYDDENVIIKRLFDETFHRLKGRYAYFRDLLPKDVREAYFAKSKEGRAIDTDSRTTDEREAERSAFELIMRQKEQQLSLSEPPICFIFAHSALREGWDNPNVFQICTLNQTVSAVKICGYSLKIYEILQRDQFLPHGFKGHGTSPSHRRFFFRPPSPQAQSWALPQVERLLSARNSMNKLFEPMASESDTSGNERKERQRTDARAAFLNDQCQRSVHHRRGVLAGGR